MEIEVLELAGAGSNAVVAELVAKAGTAPADFAFLAVNATHPADAICGPELQGLARSVHGATSCRGGMSHRGSQAEMAGGVTAFLLRDPDGDYGSGLARIDDDPRDAGRRAVQAALAQAGRLGEVPDIVWMTATPGAEEAVLLGIEEVVGAGVPVVGGSAADNDVSGAWYVFAGGQSATPGVAVSVLFPSTPVSIAFQNGYSPTEWRGRVTCVEGRQLVEIDGRPAGDVLAMWNGGATGAPEDGQARSILQTATFWPLGRKVARLQGIPYYLLAHPATAEADGGIGLFANLDPGEEITQMQGDVEALVARAGRVAAQAVPLGQSTDRIAGALMVYCGGCMLAVRPQLDAVVAATGAALGGAPFLGYFSFGEQGPVFGKRNRHGNLMVSCIVFSRD